MNVKVNVKSDEVNVVGVTSLCAICGEPMVPGQPIMARVFCLRSDGLSAYAVYHRACGEREN